MSKEDPKQILAKAEKQIATAKEALAETDRIRRLQEQLEKESAALIDTADPEDRPQMKQLGEINAQLQVIPRRKEKTLEKQMQAGLDLCETAEQFSRTIQALHGEETEKRIGEIAGRLRADFPDQTRGNGEVIHVSRNIAASAPIFDHLRNRIKPNTTLPPQRESECSNDPAGTLPRCIAHVAELHVILSEYFVNRKTFAEPGFAKAAN